MSKSIKMDSVYHVPDHRASRRWKAHVREKLKKISAKNGWQAGEQRTIREIMRRDLP